MTYQPSEGLINEALTVYPVSMLGNTVVTGGERGLQSHLIKSSTMYSIKSL